MSTQRNGNLGFGRYVSPPFLHEIPSEDRYEPTAPLSAAWADVDPWRKAARERLINGRLSIPAERHKQLSERIAARLDRIIGDIEGRLIGLYWPFRGEPDLRNWMTRSAARGALIALPVIIRRDWPLEFRRWQPGAPLERDMRNIPVPSYAPAVWPSVVIAPVVGFDEANYRLGHGGGFAQSRISSIYPQPHDIPMDIVVTEE